MRVLVIIDSFNFGGAENLLAVLGKAAPSADLEIHVASLAPESQGRNALAQVIREAGLETSFLDVPRLAHASALPRLVRAIRASRCDVVHAHLGYASTLAPPAARLAGRPCVATLHHVPQPVPRREQVKEWLSVTVPGVLGCLVFVSEASRRAFAERYAERPGSWRTIYNGVDLQQFSPGPGAWPPDLAMLTGRPVATVVAALREPKGHRVAIEAWRSVVEHAPDATLLVVGDGEQRDVLEQQARSTGVADRVVFAGVRYDVPDLLRASTLVVLPSFTEALPTSLIEAAACGRAAVATEVGGVAEVVDDGKSGLLVRPRDADGLAQAVLTVLGDQARRSEMERHARATAVERFDMVAWAHNLRELYEEQLGHR